MLDSQVGRNPPLYCRCSTEQQQSHLDKAAEDTEKEKSQNEFVQTVKEVLRQPFNQRPAAVYWMEGPHKRRMEALLNYAVGPQPMQDTRNLAMESLRLCGLTITANGTVPVLEELKILERHAPLALLRAGIKGEFSEKLESVAQVVSLQVMRCKTNWTFKPSNECGRHLY